MRKLSRIDLRKICYISLFAIAFSLLPSIAYSQSGASFVNASETDGESNIVRFSDWKIVGPNGGDVRSILVDPADSNHFYFTTLDGQIYTSNDAGKSWHMLANLNRPQLVLDSMLIDIRDSKTLYVGGYVIGRNYKELGGFFKSNDGGVTWRESKELKTSAIHSLAQSTQNPDMILAGTAKGVYASYDSGNEWKKISDETVVPGLVDVESLAIDPRNSDVIYAGTFYRPYKTTDGGKNWRLISKGMIDDSDVFAINIDPRDPDHIIASACSGIYDSRDAGENWKKIQGIPSTSRRTRDILQHPSKKGYIFAGTTEGFWMSADGGATWSLTTTRQLEINSITVPADEPNKVYIGTNNYGVMVSTNYGKSFTQTNAGYSTRQANLIVPDAEIPNRFYAATTNTATGGGFFFVSNDAGATWQASMKNFPRTLIVYSILQDPANPNTIYLGTFNGVYRSLDRGASWAAVTAPKPKAAPRRAAPKGKAAAKKRATTAKKPAAAADTTTATAEKPKLPAKVAALTEKVNLLIPTRDGKNGMYAATDKGLFRTYDIAKGWERVAFPEDFDIQVLAFAVSADNPKLLWAGTAKSGVLSSRDGGATWQQEADVPTLYPISHIEADANDANRVYVGTKQTFFMTKNGGESWERRGGGLPAGDYNSIVINPNNSNEIFAGSSQEFRDGLFHSVDGGKSWERVDTNKLNLPSRRIWALTIDPRNPNLLLVGSHSAGIYRVERGLTAATNE